MSKRNIVYLQSGGPTAVINASLYGLIKAAKESPEIDGIYGSLHGIEGLIHDDLVDLRKEEDETLELLLQTPGAALGSTRYKLDPNDLETLGKIEATLRKHHIDIVFVNGGNDSMDTCYRLSQYFKGKGIQIIGVPKTVDNDLSETDHCLGFGSAARSIINTVKGLFVDVSAYPKGKVTIVEIIGRDTGWLTATTSLIEGAEPDLIYVPEMGFDEKLFLSQVKEIYDKKKYVNVVISEAIDLPRQEGDADAFGHVILEGIVHQACALIKRELGLPTRGVCLSLTSRSDAAHISKTDSDEAIRMSAFLLDAALKGASGVVGCLDRIENDPYRCNLVLKDAKDIANTVRMMPTSWIASFGHIKKEEVARYALPLISGDMHPINENGQLKVAKLKLQKI